MSNPVSPLFRRNAPTPRYGVARVISKAGLCSRSEAERRVRDGRVQVNAKTIRDPETPVRMGVDEVRMDGVLIDSAPRLYLMLNKPRGLVTTATDERGRDTVYRCFDGAELPWIAPVGRLDKASEGLLLFSNDPVWAARITDPSSGPDKTYHVQVAAKPQASVLAALLDGVREDGELLRAKHAGLLREGDKNAWLEIVLDEGRNRQIRRLLAAFDIEVLRLVRVAIGEVVLGDLAKGTWRQLTDAELSSLK